MRNKLYLFGLAVVVVIMPLLKGGNSEWARMGLITFVVVLALISFLFQEGESIVSGSKAAKLWWFVWAVFSLWMVFQYYGLNLFLKFSIEKSQIFGVVYPQGALNYWALFSVYWFISWMAYRLSAQQAKFFVWLIVGIAFFQALYGLVALVGGFNTFFGVWVRETYSQLNATGSFVNRNHFAGFLALCLPLGLSCFYSRQMAGWLKSFSVLRHGMAVMFLLVILIAILGTTSKLGMFVALIALACWLCFYFARKSEILKQSPVSVVLIGGVVVAGLVWFGAGGLVGRLMDINFDARTDVWHVMLSMPITTWLYGVGADGYADVFRTIAPWHVQGSEYVEAHNDILEFVFDFGLIGACLIFGSFVLWFVSLKPKHWTLVHLGALSGILAILLHSFGDFDLQIPGLAVVFWTFIGLMVNPSLNNFRRSL